MLKWNNQMQNSGTVNLKGGTIGGGRDIIGGTINILGDVNFGSYFQGKTLNVVEGAVLKCTSANILRSETIINDGIISITGSGTIESNYVKNPITGSGYIEFAAGGAGSTSYVKAAIAQEMPVIGR